ncbi:MAG: hypothetical protein HOQ01_01305, partial [Lysobacter sp.]|nr:hypothetical protein [Lysobacter sp.]
APPAPPPAPAAAFIDDDGNVTTFKDARIAYVHTTGDNGADIELVEALPPAQGTFTSEDGTVREVRVQTIENVEVR